MFCALIVILQTKFHVVKLETLTMIFRSGHRLVQVIDFHMMGAREHLQIIIYISC